MKGDVDDRLRSLIKDTRLAQGLPADDVAEVQHRCPRKHPLAAADDRCAECWLEAAMEPLPCLIGRYEPLERLGGGAHGTVYRARQSDGIEVALKTMSKGVAEREIGSLMRLRHPHIVRISASGVDQDPPHFAMQLMRGGSLQARLDASEGGLRYRNPKHALELMVPIADAVHYAHQNSVLHCDLKPANILLDEQGRPHVSDFSVAKSLDEGGRADGASAAGTYPYMPPELVGAVAAEITTASDVYGLGALLYRLLAVRPPRLARTADELRDAFFRDERPEPLALAPRWRWRDLEAVCLRALSTDPQQRHDSAASFADDLRRVQRGRWLVWRPPSTREKLSRWLRRSPALAISTVAGAVMLASINAVAYAGVQRQQRELQQLVLASNAALAKAQAQAALAELRKLRQRVLETLQTRRPRLEALLRAPTPEKDRPKVGFVVPGFDNVFILNCAAAGHGYSAARGSPAFDKVPPADYWARTYTYRDYFRGAMDLARRGRHDVYVGRAYRSTRDARFYFALSAPLYSSSPDLPACGGGILDGSGRRPVGVFVASRSASAALGAVQIPQFAGSGQRTALFGPRDRDSADAPIPDGSHFHALVHERLRAGDERSIDPELARRLSTQFGETAPAGRQFDAVDAAPLVEPTYIDTLDDPDVTRLGGFFPVGRTGLIVGVSTANGRAIRPMRTSETLLTLNLAFFAYCCLILWLSARRADFVSQRNTAGES